MVDALGYAGDKVGGKAGVLFKLIEEAEAGFLDKYL